MRRGDIYRVHRPEGDPKQYRSYVVISRQILIDSRYSTVICAPDRALIIALGLG
jgi:mRNA interferase MazF